MKYINKIELILVKEKHFKRENIVRLLEIYEKSRALYPSLCNSELRELAIKEFERSRERSSEAIND